MRIEFRHLRINRVDPKGLDLPSDINDPVVHGIAEILSGIAEDDHASSLHHEARECTGAAADDDGAPFLIDPGAAADVAHAHHVAAAQGCGKARSCAFLDDPWPRQHVLGTAPANSTFDVDVRTIDQSAAEISEPPVKVQTQSIENPNA